MLDFMIVSTRSTRNGVEVFPKFVMRKSKDLMVRGGDFYAIWDEEFDKGFEQIFASALSNNSEGIATGLDKILSVFGESVRFKTTNEFEEFFFSDDTVLVL